MGLVADFRKFAFKGSVVDLAVGVVLGVAFGSVVTAVVGDVIMPLVSLALPSGDWRKSALLLRRGVTPADDVTLKYGDLLGAVLNFLIIALVLFVIVSRVLRAFERSRPVVATKDCPECREPVKLDARRCKHCCASIVDPA